MIIAWSVARYASLLSWRPTPQLTLGALCCRSHTRAENRYCRSHTRAKNSWWIHPTI